jgi:hypothetical protein
VRFFPLPARFIFVPNEPRDLEFDVLPPERNADSEPLVRLIARLMDSLFRIPGTKIRFGLDPIIGLLPGIGDTLTGLISTFLIARSARMGLPKIVMARMAFNVLANSLVGAIPIAGDAFSFFFKSNVRNYRLMEKHAGQSRSTRGDWLFFCVLIVAVLLVLLFAVVGAALMLSRIFRAGSG